MATIFPKNRTEITTLINNSLTPSTGNLIEATAHRAAEHAVLDYVASRVLATGVEYIGDPGGNAGWTYTVELGITLPTTNYIVIGNYISQGNWNDDNDAVWCIKSKGLTSFDIYLSEFNGTTQNLSFGWMAVYTPTSYPTTI
ncbi:hypothetical protein UFOVP54_77 [uncultured Caudovirales phage]|uniref:Uncharacterized protein n=1 Tax=uncultured Caudovirales phage TaxID=2100421 RepID=A0A6J5KVW1_9CAUD|nr:hypothetical protein UFOVP54_77 [uncultured Caudovirales phage]